MIMICTWNHTLTYNEKDLKRAVIFTISLTVTHAHTHKSVHMYTSSAVHSYTSIHRFFHPVLRLLEAAICSLFLPFVPFLSSLWLIKSPVLWYTAKPPGHFYGLLGPLFLPSFHCFNPPPPKKNEQCNTLLSRSPGSVISLFRAMILFSNWGISCPAIIFGLLREATWLNGFPFEDLTADTRPACGFPVSCPDIPRAQPGQLHMSIY